MTEYSIYRYKLNENVIQTITEFSKIHQYDNRTDYKEAWRDWCDDNSDTIDKETRRLNNLGYQGNVIDKMYKAGRYYFRKKNITEKPEPKTRRIYVSMDSEILELMDKHIMKNKTKDYSPAKGYSEFCEKNVDILREEVGRLFNCGLSGENINSKIKKNYKIRYFISTRNDEDN